jgi:hypothetical protein
MTIVRDVATLRQAAAGIAADLTAATGTAWSIAVSDDLVVTATRDGTTVKEVLAADLDEDDWEWDDLDAEILPITLWHDATEAVWDVVDGGFYCWANVIPACPRDGAAPLLLSSAVWSCRTHAHDVAAIGELGAAQRS